MPQETIEVRLLRAADLVVAGVVAYGCSLSGQDADRVLAAGPEALLVLHLPPQHLGERAWPIPAGDPEPPPETWPAGAYSAHRAAAPSRLVFEVPEGTAIPYTLDGVLAAIPRLRLRVAGHATPAPAPRPDRPDRPWRPWRPLPPWWRGLPLPGPTNTAEDEEHPASLEDLVYGVDPAIALAASSRSDAATRLLLRAQATRVARGYQPTAPAAFARRPIRDLLPWRPIEPIGPIRPIPFPRPRPSGPDAPTPTETAIEAPYRVTVSPSVQGAFVHPVQPLTADDDPTRVELWRTHLTVRVEDDEGAFVGTDETDTTQRIVRAIWSRDMDPQDAGAFADPPALNPQSLLPRHRRGIVRQSSDVRIPDEVLDPIRVGRFSLSSLGAWIDWVGSWDTDTLPAPSDPGLVAELADYRHKATMGRDSFVRVTEPGILFCLGHRALWVTETQRIVANRADPVARLWQRQYIEVREPIKGYGEIAMPFPIVALDPLVTPNLDPAPNPLVPFVPTRGGVPFAFTLLTVDRGGTTPTFAAPLVFVPNTFLKNTNIDVQALADNAYHTGGIDRIPGRGQTVGVAQAVTAGDTSVEANHLVLDGTIDRANLTSRPSLRLVNAVVPAMRHLAPQAPGVDLAYADPYLASGAGEEGFGPDNPGQVFLKVASTAPAVDFSGGSDRSGGFLAPNLVVRGLSRSLGAVGENGTGASGLSQGQFDPATFLDGALPKLFGLFGLLDLLEALGLDGAPEFLTESLDAVSSIVSEADRLRQAADDVGPRLADEISKAAHDGAKAGLEAARDALDAAITPLLTALDALADAIAGLANGPAGLPAVTTALTGAADAVDALLAQVAAPQLPAALRAALEKPARALATLARAAETLEALADFVEGLLSPSTAVTARFEWRPQIKSWPGPGDDAVFDARNPRGMSLAVEVRGSATTPPSADVTAELADFALQLLPGEPLMAMAFQRIGFRASSTGKVEVDVVFGGIEFLGPLAFIDKLRQMIPFDGFADPPYVDVSPEGVTAGFDLALPNVSVGVFSIENISLGADARVPFLGDAVSVGFHFCTKDSPFRMTVMCIGGGGWVELRASPKGLVLLEVGLEATACLSIDLGVASGSVSIAVGVYLRLEGDVGSLTAYFRIRGEVDVLGLISASITLELSLTYHFESGKLIGRASLVVEVEVLFFSASVEVSCERKLAGSKGDPTLGDVMPPAPDGTNADWSLYCSAFAPAA